MEYTHLGRGGLPVSWLALGTTNFGPATSEEDSHIARVREAARSQRCLGLVTEQSTYNQMTRWVELEVLPAARHYGLGVIPWSPLHSGVLNGVLRADHRTADGRGPNAGQACARAYAW